MEEVREAKQELRAKVEKAINGLEAEDRQQKLETIQERLFDFANFLEARIVLLYVNAPNEVPSMEIIQKTVEIGKIVVLPAFDVQKSGIKLMKIDNPNRDLIMGPRQILEPNPQRCRKVPLECIDIAIIPGVALDEKGGRLGAGDGYYDRLIPKLPITTRKVALAIEDQIFQQVPMESHDKYVDIIVTNKRVIYKI
ncbi:MAG: 5-formyltetrahydrofolate cyclo-ligase [Desulfobacterales bacterium]|nr:5-formyltetrahydrofolate cyclo-ligase [Desulfobacterales bacterium]MDJ0882528.1 5-formyltetrahydrofolate cyclo-ligase [Desulfobacterales bacterium]